MRSVLLPAELAFDELFLRVTPHIMQWLRENAPNYDGKWYLYHPSDYDLSTPDDRDRAFIEFWFSDPSEAALFKLTFG